MARCLGTSWCYIGKKSILKYTDNTLHLWHIYYTRYQEKGSSINKMVFRAKSKTVIDLCVLPSARYNLASYRTGHPEVLQPGAHWLCTTYIESTTYNDKSRHWNTSITCYVKPKDARQDQIRSLCSAKSGIIPLNIFFPIQQQQQQQHSLFFPSKLG